MPINICAFVWLNTAVPRFPKPSFCAGFRNALLIGCDLQAQLGQKDIIHILLEALGSNLLGKLHCHEMLSYVIIELSHTLPNFCSARCLWTPATTASLSSRLPVASCLCVFWSGRWWWWEIYGTIWQIFLAKLEPFPMHAAIAMLAVLAGCFHLCDPVFFHLWYNFTYEFTAVSVMIILRVAWGLRWAACFNSFSTITKTSSIGDIFNRFFLSQNILNWVYSDGIFIHWTWIRNTAIHRRSFIIGSIRALLEMFSLSGKLWDSKNFTCPHSSSLSRVISSIPLIRLSNLASKSLQSGIWASVTFACLSMLHCSASIGCLHFAFIFIQTSQQQFCR